MTSKPSKIVTLAFSFCILFLTTSLEANRQKHRINLDWKYHQGDHSPAPTGKNADDSNWDDVALPHTYQLTSINLDDSPDANDQPTFHRDISWYRRAIAPKFRPGQRVFLEFEGAHQKTDLWVNGKHVGEHAVSAYTPFHFDITDFVTSGQTNTIALKLDNRKTDQIPPDGHIWDFVLFGGLYRDVYLVVTDPIHITFPWEKREAGVAITTPSVSHKAATVSIRSTIRNHHDTPQSVTVINRIIDATDTVVARIQKSTTVAPTTDTTVVMTGGIDENLHLWSPDSPYLYRVNTQILADGNIVDSIDNPLGFRWFEYRLGQGFLLNGEPLELIGANRHQQYPYIGDAVPNNLHRSDAIKMKRAGMNIVRLAHYPHDDSFLDACDELGLLVCEEPPTWMEFGPKTWMDRLEESLRIAIRNHRNHPSIWGWGAGINHRGPVKRLHYAAKEEDPTRVTMNNATVWTGPQHSGITDLYSTMDYRSNKRPNAKRPEGELLFAMEHSGSTDTRETEIYLNSILGDPNYIGATVWSAHDNYSFAKRKSRYPNLSRWSAAIWDAFRLPKPNHYLYKSQLTSEPMVHIPDHRAQHDDSVLIFSNCQSVELFHNGKSLGIRSPERNANNQHLPAPSITYPFSWTSGALEVRGYNNGKTVATHTVRKPEAPVTIDLAFDTDGFRGYADGSSIVLAYATVRDKHDQVIEGDTPPITFSISGPAEIVGDASIGANPVSWENGVAPIFVRIGRQAGTIRLTATSPGLTSDTATLATTRAPDTNPFLAKSFFEPTRLKVDFGNLQQHVEDEWLPWIDGIPDTENRTLRGNWTAWTSGSKNVSKKSFQTSNGKRIAATLSGNGTRLNWTHSWGVPGDLCFMIEDGVATTAAGELTLTFLDLPAGTYQIKTWHHVIKGDEEDAPRIQIATTDARGPQRLAHSAFQPSYGGAIKVSHGGIGGASDGGSHLAARTFALTTLVSDGQSPVSLQISTQASTGTFTLNGFDLLETQTP